MRTAPITNLLAGSVSRPAIPANNSRDACGNALATDIEALPPVMVGADSTARIDAHLARVSCPACGNPKPTRAEFHDSILARTLASEGNADSAIEGAIRAEAVVREFARLCFAECMAHQNMPPFHCAPKTGDQGEWDKYATAMRLHQVGDQAWSDAIRVRNEFITANLPALRAALGGVA